MAEVCPCVGFDCGTGPRSLIEDGVNGVLAPAEDVESREEEIGHLIEDEVWRKDLAEQAVGARDRFSEERVMVLWGRILLGLWA